MFAPWTLDSKKCLSDFCWSSNVLQGSLGGVNAARPSLQVPSCTTLTVQCVLQAKKRSSDHSAPPSLPGSPTRDGWTPAEAAQVQAAADDGMPPGGPVDTRGDEPAEPSNGPKLRNRPGTVVSTAVGSNGMLQQQ